MPVTSEINDLMGENMEVAYMKKNCKSHDQETFRIERIIKHDYKNKRMLVKWKGYPDKFNSCVSLR